MGDDTSKLLTRAQRARMDEAGNRAAERTKRSGGTEEEANQNAGIAERTARRVIKGDERRQF